MGFDARQEIVRLLKQGLSPMSDERIDAIQDVDELAAIMVEMARSSEQEARARLIADEVADTMALSDQTLSSEAVERLYQKVLATEQAKGAQLPAAAPSFWGNEEGHPA